MKRFLKDTRKIYVADMTRYDLPFGVLGRLEFDERAYLQNPRAYKAVILTGGADLYPGLYGHHMHRDCMPPDIARDRRDLMVAQVALRWGIPIVGICRGAQLLNVLAGGWLVQDCDGHGVWHNVETSDGRLIEVSSTHHQMMVPPKKGGELLAWAAPRLSTYYKGGKRCGFINPKTIQQETDCIFFPRMRALALQYHPEYMRDDSPAFGYALELFETKLGLPVVKSSERDPFVSLPKDDPATLEQVDESDPKAVSLRWKKDFFKARQRIHMANLMTKGEAAEKARDELVEYLADLRARSIKTADISATRAAKVSE